MEQDNDMKDKQLTYDKLKEEIFNLMEKKYEFLTYQEFDYTNDVYEELYVLGNYAQELLYKKAHKSNKYYEFYIYM